MHGARRGAGREPAGLARYAPSDAAAELLRDRLAERLRNPGAGRAGEPPATGLLEAIRDVERARSLARGNVNPQLIVADLARLLAERLA